MQLIQNLYYSFYKLLSLLILKKKLEEVLQLLKHPLNLPLQNKLYLHQMVSTAFF